jgi:hypothetical protein
MLSRRASVGIGLLALLVATGAVEYHGTLEGLVLLGLVALGAGIGYRAGTVLEGGLYGAAVGIGLALVVLVVGIVALIAVVLLTIPQHRGWGFLALGIGPGMLFSPLGLIFGLVYFGGSALFCGLGGVVGGAVARGRTLSVAAWKYF